MALGVLMLWWHRRESVYLWFAVFAASWACHGLWSITANVPVSDEFWDLAMYVCMGWIVASGAIFTLRLFDRPKPIWERAVIFVAGAVPPCLLLPMALLGDLRFLNDVANLLWLGGVLLFALWPMTLGIAQAQAQRRPELFLLGASYVMAMSLGTYDWMIAAGIGYRQTGLLLYYATIPLVASFGYILLRRYASALNESESLVGDLENRVAARAREIEIAFRRTRELERAQLLSRERERIVRDIHDGFGGQLIGAIGELDGDTDRERRLKEDLSRALQDLRLMIDSLDAADGDVVLLLGLLRNRIQPQVESQAVALSWEVDTLPGGDSLGPERALHFMRIVQEALTNALRHADAKQIRVATRETLAVDGVDCAAVVVTDDGRGLPSEPRLGRGLRNMRYRAGAAGFRLEICGSDAGTSVLVGIPPAPSR